MERCFGWCASMLNKSLNGIQMERIHGKVISLTDFHLTSKCPTRSVPKDHKYSPLNTHKYKHFQKVMFLPLKIDVRLNIVPKYCMRHVAPV